MLIASATEDAEGRDESMIPSSLHLTEIRLCAALQRRNILFFWQEGPKEARRIEPKKTKKDAKRAMTRTSSACPFFRFFSVLSAMVIGVAAGGRAASSAV
jgi:hypothetical protein